jgi:hypothetical protein
VAFDENPATVPVLPAGGNPDGVRAGRQLPSAAFPDVTTAIPSVIAADPDMASAGSDTAAFDYNSRRPLSHDDLRGLRGSDPYNDSKTRGEKNFPHLHLLWNTRSNLAAIL